MYVFHFDGWWNQRALDAPFSIYIYFCIHPHLRSIVMIREVTIRRYGGSLGTTLPKAMTDRLSIGAGDKVYAVETERGILLTPLDPDFLRVMEAEERISKKYQNALSELAK
jgi:putative addiction module antidote